MGSVSPCYAGPAHAAVVQAPSQGGALPVGGVSSICNTAAHLASHSLQPQPPHQLLKHQRRHQRQGHGRQLCRLCRHRRCRHPLCRPRLRQSQVGQASRVSALGQLVLQYAFFNTLHVMVLPLKLHTNSARLALVHPSRLSDLMPWLDVAEGGSEAFATPVRAIIGGVGACLGEHEVWVLA